MLAIILDNTFSPQPLTQTLRKGRRTTDGPFEVFEGVTADDCRVWIYRTNDHADEMYIATRLALRRDARAVVHVGTAVIEREFSHEIGRSPGDWVIPAKVYDLRGLEAIQHLTSENHPPGNTPWPKNVPGRPRLAANLDENESLSLGSLALPLTIPSLAGDTKQCHQIGIFDCGAVGVLDACGESQRVAPLIFKYLRDVVTPSWAKTAEGYQTQTAQLRALETLATNLWTIPELLAGV